MADQPVHAVFDWPENAIHCMARTCVMNMPNGTCVGTQTSMVATRVALAFISIL